MPAIQVGKDDRATVTNIDSKLFQYLIFMCENEATFSSKSLEINPDKFWRTIDAVYRLNMTKLY